jgi:NADPH:quinone reductase
VSAVASEGVTAALDTVGSDEAVDVSLALVGDRKRIVTIAAFSRAKKDGIKLLGASNPASAPYRASQRARLLRLAGEGKLEVPIGATYPIDEAPAALAALMGRHPYGKLALVG